MVLFDNCVPVVRRPLKTCLCTWNICSVSVPGIYVVSLYLEYSVSVPGIFCLCTWNILSLYLEYGISAQLAGKSQAGQLTVVSNHVICL